MLTPRGLSVSCSSSRNFTSHTMKRRTILLSLLVSIILFPASAAAFQERRDYSDYWNLTGEERAVDLSEMIGELEMDLRRYQLQIDKHEEEYITLREGLNYERATLARERQALNETVERNQLIERDILSRFSIVGAPNHLKRWRLQRALRNAQKILATDSVVPYQDLERREKLLANEAEQLERAYIAKRRSLRRGEVTRMNEIYAMKNEVNYAKSDRRNIFLTSILKPERENFLLPRKLRASVSSARRAQAVKDAVLRARTDNYLTRVQPQVQSELAAELTSDALDELRMFEKELLESLGSNLSAEQLKRLSLDNFMSGN